MRLKKSITDPNLLRTISDGLSGHPELAARIDTIVRLANEPMDDGQLRSAHEVEALLVEELRNLGNETIQGWSSVMDRRLGEQLKEEEPTTQMREKKL